MRTSWLIFAVITDNRNISVAYGNKHGFPVITVTEGSRLCFCLTLPGSAGFSWAQVGLARCGWHSQGAHIFLFESPGPWWFLIETCCSHDGGLKERGRTQPRNSTPNASAWKRAANLLVFHWPKQVKWPSLKSVGWGNLTGERKWESVNKWYKMKGVVTGNWRQHCEARAAWCELPLCGQSGASRGARRRDLGG